MPFFFCTQPRTEGVIEEHVRAAFLLPDQNIEGVTAPAPSMLRQKGKALRNGITAVVITVTQFPGHFYKGSANEKMVIEIEAYTEYQNTGNKETEKNIS